MLGHDGAVHLQHLLLQDKVVAPLLENVGLDGATRGTKVIETGHTTVDVEGGPDKEPPGEDVLHSGAVEGAVLLLLGGLLQEGNR